MIYILRGAFVFRNIYYPYYDYKLLIRKETNMENYIAKFDLKPEFKGSEFEKKLAIDLFTKARNLFCDLANECYEKWNDEYDEQKDGSYDSYISKKQQVVVDVVNGQLKKSAPIKQIMELKLNEHNDVDGVYKSIGQEYTISMYIVPSTTK